MNKRDLINLLETLPEDADITIQTCHYDGNSDVYESQEPKIIRDEYDAILTGNNDIYAQRDAAYYHLSDLSRTDINSILDTQDSIVRVDK